jgi:hypothetical protein
MGAMGELRQAEAKRDAGWKASRVSTVLMACAGVLTGFAFAQPSAMAVVNALMFWAWTAASLQHDAMAARHSVCAACGAVEPLRLPDRSCAACAAPLRRSFPDLAEASEQGAARNADDRPSTSW